jgi:hypothetical protein
MCSIRALQSCVFQIVAEEKYRKYKALNLAVKHKQKEKKVSAAALHAKEEQALLRKADKRRGSEVSKDARRRAQAGGDVTPDHDVGECIKEIEVENPQLCALARSESRDNSLEQNRWHGSPVHYGDIVQLWHNYSRKFVHVSKSENALTEPSSMSVEMRPGIAHGCHFKIMPR